MSFPIAEVARRCGLSIDTLRYYERIELVDPPARDSAGRRVYCDDDLAWLEFITKLRGTGMPIRRMREYAELRRLDPASAGPRMAILIEQRRSVLERIKELTGYLDVLDYKITNYQQIEKNWSETEIPADGVKSA